MNEATHTTRKALVTGANGFIGSRICRSLKASGVDVVAGVRRGANMDSLEGLKIPLAYGELTKPETFEELIAGVDTVVHNAGLVKARRPEQLFEINTDGTLALYSACIEAPHIKRFIYISSQSAAGPSSGKPKIESDIPAPITTYGRSKLKAEQGLLADMSKLNLQIVRPPGVYGPGDREVFTFFQTVSRGIRPLIGNMKRRINLVYVDDLADGIAKLVTHKLESGKIYFIAEPQSYSFEEIIGHIGKAVNKKGLPLPIPGWMFKTIGAISQTLSRSFGMIPMLTREKANEILQSWEISVERAREDFGFAPQVSFPQGAQLTANWYREHGWI